MNFKPTLWKTIISAVLGFLVDVLLSQTYITCMGEFCPQPTGYSHIFDPAAITFWIVSAIIIYTIWSLFEKK